MFVSWSIIQASPTIYSTTPHSQSTTHPPPFSSTTALFFNSPPTTSSSSPTLPHSFVDGGRLLFGIDFMASPTTPKPPPLTANPAAAATALYFRLYRRHQVNCHVLPSECASACPPFHPSFANHPPLNYYVSVLGMCNVSSWLWHHTIHHHRIETSS